MLTQLFQDPSHFISIVSSPEMANDLCQTSPFQFDYVPQQRPHHPTPPVAAPDAKKTFYVKITPSPEYPHKTRIRESPLYGRWPEHDGMLWHNDSLPKAVLARELPRDMARRGLADWEGCGQREDSGEDSAAAVAAWLESKKDYVAARKLRREREGKWESLVEMFREEWEEEKDDGQEGQ